MRKFRMLIFTLIIMILTTLSYAYENFNIEAPEFKQPSININSKKFGKIKNVSWFENYLSSDLLILSSDSENYNNLYYLSVDTGESKLIHRFPPHKTLDDVILFDRLSSGSDIITTYDEGIIKIKVRVDENNKLTYEPETLVIEGFENANSMDLRGNLVFTKPNDNFIYIKKLYTQSFPFFTGSNVQNDITKHYKKPYYIVSADNLDSSLTYTSLKRNGINVYSMDYNGTPISKFNKPIIQNVVTATKIGTPHGYGYIGMNIENNSKDSIDVFMVRNALGNTGSSFKLDSIPFNLDMFGAVPSIDVITFNEDYSLIYTSYDKENKGQIKVINYNEEPKVIVRDKNLFGPVKINGRYNENGNIKHILYFIYENNETHAKICDIEGNLVKDITDIIK